MKRSWVSPVGALILVIAVTFPWDLQGHPHWYKVAWVPFVTGILRAHDLLLNAALYFPLGFFLPIRPRLRRVVWATAVALLSSAILELAQVWSHVRFPSATDVVMNVVGSLAGAALGRRDDAGV